MYTKQGVPVNIYQILCNWFKIQLYFGRFILLGNELKWSCGIESESEQWALVSSSGSKMMKSIILRSLELRRGNWFIICINNGSFENNKSIMFCHEDGDNWPMALAVYNFFNGDTPNSSQVDGVRGRWLGGVGPTSVSSQRPQNTLIRLCRVYHLFM